MMTRDWMMTHQDWWGSAFLAFLVLSEKERKRRAKHRASVDDCAEVALWLRKVNGEWPVELFVPEHRPVDIVSVREPVELPLDWLTLDMSSFATTRVIHVRVTALWKANGWWAYRLRGDAVNRWRLFVPPRHLLEGP